PHDTHPFSPASSTLPANASTGRRTEVNITDTDSDGVEIMLGQADYCEVASPSLPLPPPNGRLTFDFHGLLDRLPDRTVSMLTMQANAVGETQISADMGPLGATRYTLLAFDGETQVAALTNMPSALFSVINDASVVRPTLRW